MKLGFCAVFGLFLILSPALSRGQPDEAKIEDALAFASGTLEEWTVEGEGTWFVQYAPEFMTNPGDALVHVCGSHPGGEGKTGMLRSSVFMIDAPYQMFLIAGSYGTAKRIETSGHYRNGPACWLWVEGITGARGVDIQWR